MFQSIVYPRAKGDLDTVPYGTVPYGTQGDVYRNGYEWLGHSLGAHTVEPEGLDCRVEIGEPDCWQKYSTSLLNISAMRYGSLSSAALIALNKGAKGEVFITTRVKVGCHRIIWKVQMRSGKLVLVILVAGRRKGTLVQTSSRRRLRTST